MWKLAKLRSKKTKFPRVSLRQLSSSVKDNFVIKKLECQLPNYELFSSVPEITCTTIGKPLFDAPNLNFDETLFEPLPQYNYLQHLLPPPELQYLNLPPQPLLLNPPPPTEQLLQPGNTVYLTPKSGRKLELRGHNNDIELICLPTLEETDSGGGSKGYGYEGKEIGLAPFKLPRKQTKGASAGAMTSVIVASGTKPEFLRSIVEQVSASTTGGKGFFAIGKGLLTGGLDQVAMVQKVREKLYEGVLPKLQKLLENPQLLGADATTITSIVASMKQGGPLTLGQLQLCAKHHKDIAATGATITVHDATIDGEIVELDQPQSLYVSHENYPDTDVAELAVVSGALPLVFKRQTLDLGKDLNGKRVTVTASDGGVLNNAPFSESVLATQGELGLLVPDREPFETIMQLEFGFKNANKVSLESSLGMADLITGAPNGVMSQVVKLMANGRIKEIVANNDWYNGILGTTAFLNVKRFQDSMRQDFVEQGQKIGQAAGELAFQPIKIRAKNWPSLCYRMDDQLLDEACHCDIEDDPEEGQQEAAEQSRQQRGVTNFAEEAKRVREARQAIAKQAAIIGNALGQSLEKALAALEQLEQFCIDEQTRRPNEGKVAYAARQLCRYLPVIENFARFKQLVGQWTETHPGAGVLKATLRGAEQKLIVRDGMEIAKTVIAITKQYAFDKAAQNILLMSLQSFLTCDKLPGLYTLADGIAVFFENLPVQHWPQIEDNYPETSGAEMSLEQTRAAIVKTIRQVVAELRKKRLGD